MSWVIAGSTALLAFLAIAFLFRAPRQGWEAIGAALLLGLAGYALQGSPGKPGAPKDAEEKFKDGSGLVEARKALGNGDTRPGSSWLTISDAMTRNGQYGNAAAVLLGAVKRNPNDGEAWLAMANDLTAHAEGNLSPAALYAFQNAVRSAPDQPGPQIFLGLALAQNGRLEEARSVWADLLRRTPPQAPWREKLAKQLAELDAYIAQQQQGVTSR